LLHGRGPAVSSSRAATQRAAADAGSAALSADVVTSNKCIAVRKVATPLRELTYHVGSHSVTCHPAELTFPPKPQRKLVLD